MESSIAVFLMRQHAFERLPTLKKRSACALQNSMWQALPHFAGFGPALTWVAACTSRRLLFPNHIMKRSEIHNSSWTALNSRVPPPLCVCFCV